MDACFRHGHAGAWRVVGLLAWPSRTFNLVVSWPAALYMRGCPLQAVYAVDPLSDRHTVSVAMTTVRDRPCFGIYADRKALPDADKLPTRTMRRPRSCWKASCGADPPARGATIERTA